MKENKKEYKKFLITLLIVIGIVIAISFIPQNIVELKDGNIDYSDYYPLILFNYIEIFIAIIATFTIITNWSIRLIQKYIETKKFEEPVIWVIILPLIWIFIAF